MSLTNLAKYKLNLSEIKVKLKVNNYFFMRKKAKPSTEFSILIGAFNQNISRIKSILKRKEFQPPNDKSSDGNKLNSELRKLKEEKKKMYALFKTEEINSIQINANQLETMSNDFKKLVIKASVNDGLDTQYLLEMIKENLKDK